jgi:hypothetical protein
MPVPEIELDPYPDNGDEESILDQLSQFMPVYQMRFPAFYPANYRPRFPIRICPVHAGICIDNFRQSGLDKNQKKSGRAKPPGHAISVAKVVSEVSSDTT